MGAEKRFENKIKKYLKDRGCWCVKYFANSFTPSGIPDLLTCINGHFVAIEVKADNGEPSKLQLLNVKKIREAGGIAIILYPDQFEEFKKLVHDLKLFKLGHAKLREKTFDRR